MLPQSRKARPSLLEPFETRVDLDFSFVLLVCILAMLILRIPGVIYLQNKYLNNASSDIKFGPQAMSDDVIFYPTTPWAGW